MHVRTSVPRSEENETARQTGGLGWTLSVCERRRTLDGPVAKSVQVAMIGRVGRCTPDPISDPVLAQPCPHLDDVLQLRMFACVFFFAPSFFLIFQDVLIFASTAWWKNRDRAESVHRSQFFSCQEFLRSTQYYIRAQASRSMCSLTDSLCCYLLRDHRSSRATYEEEY